MASGADRQDGKREREKGRKRQKGNGTVFMFNTLSTKHSGAITAVGDKNEG